jgi:hypothetical protein
MDAIFGLNKMVAGGNAPVNNATSSYYADGGAVNPQVAYTDGQGNFYDASGYLVE